MPPEEDDTLGYLLENYDALKAFVERAANEGEGLIVCLSDMTPSPSACGPGPRRG